MISDFKHAFSGHAVPGTASGSTPPDSLDGEKHRIVSALLAEANRAAHQGKPEQCQFTRGMAAAFYGLIRLAEAQDLEQRLGHRLGMSVPADETRRSADASARKEIHMLATQKQFQFQDMVGFFIAEGIKFKTFPKDGAVAVQFGINEDDSVLLVARVSDEHNMMRLRFHVPVTVPNERKGDMAEAVTRANDGLPLGGFQMDWDEGELHYMVAIPTDEATVSLAQFRHCMAVAMLTVERYLPAFSQVALENVSAEEAIAACES
jgi:hypothetical protein